MELWRVCCAFGLVLLIILPWVVATALSWTYVEVGIPNSAGSGEQPTGNGMSLERAMAILQSASGILYIVYILLVLTCMCCIQEVESTCIHFCLVLGFPIFCVIPLIVAVVFTIRVIDHPNNSLGQILGATSIVLCVFSTSCCLCMTIWALCCGSVGVERNSSFPAPVAYFQKLLNDDDYTIALESYKKKRNKSSNGSIKKSTLSKDTKSYSKKSMSRKESKTVMA